MSAGGRGRSKVVWGVGIGGGRGWFDVMWFDRAWRRRRGRGWVWDAIGLISLVRCAAFIMRSADFAVFDGVESLGNVLAYLVGILRGEVGESGFDAFDRTFK